MRTLASVTVVVLALACGCTNQKSLNKKALTAAQADQAAAIGLLRKADTTAAVHRFQQVETQLEKLRRSTAPPMSEDPGDGPVVDGLTAKAWQEHFTLEFKNEIEAQLPALLAATKAGTLDWNTGRALLTAYRPDLDPQWLEGVKAAAEGEVAQRKDAYHLRCEASDKTICQKVRPLLEKKLMKPLDDKVLLERASEEQMFGTVVVGGNFGRYRKYANVKDPTRDRFFELPATLEVLVTVHTSRTSSSWDGVLQLQADLEPPTAISVDSLREEERKHFDALLEQALAPLASKPPQTMQ